MSKMYLPKVEFYITNSCNFDCPGCNRFNNYSFTGHQRWKDYQGIYEKWSQVLDLEEFSILGGEPMMNPDYLDWLEGLLNFWPQAKGSMVTNGHFIKPDSQKLYDLVQRYADRMEIQIGLHNADRADGMLSQMQQWLVGPITQRRVPEKLQDLPGFSDNWKKSYHAIKDPTWPDCNNPDDWDRLPEHIRQECYEVHDFSPEILSDQRRGYLLKDSNGVTVIILYENFFHQGALIHDRKTDSFKLHHSDPKKAHDVCHSKTCHHFGHGKLYKCGQVALFPEFYQQFHLDLEKQDLDLVHSYRPAQIDDIDHLRNFIANINQPLDQCKFCPESYEIKEIHARHSNKPKVSKRTTSWTIKQVNR